MSFIETIPEEAAEGDVASMYAQLRQSLGYLPNYGKEFSHRPALFAAWAQLNTTVKRAMDPRWYELATVAAAVRRRSSYCTLSHGEKLLELGSQPDQVVALAGGGVAGLSEVEQAIVDYSAKVAQEPSSITQEDIDKLRSLGLSDADIFDVASAAAARLFFTALADATGTQPDARYRETIPDLVDALAVGRPVAEAIPSS
jgi:uncharacterized peroxidase-related enzyme